jgi:hypothetical protein
MLGRRDSITLEKKGSIKHRLLKNQTSPKECGPAYVRVLYHNQGIHRGGSAPKVGMTGL